MSGQLRVGSPTKCFGFGTNHIIHITHYIYINHNIHINHINHISNSCINLRPKLYASICLSVRKEIFPREARLEYIFFKTLFKGNKNMRQFGVAHEI